MAKNGSHNTAWYMEGAGLLWGYPSFGRHAVKAASRHHCNVSPPTWTEAGMGPTSSHAGKHGGRGGQQILSHLGRRAVPPNIPKAMNPPSRQWLIGPWPPCLPLMCGASARRFCLLGSAPEETISRSIWGDAWVASHSCCSQGSGSVNLFHCLFCHVTYKLSRWQTGLL